ncbi:MAG: sugar O-acetyltransferase, partial [Mesorhizobium sp.]
MMRSQKEKMLAGEFYNAADPEIQADLLATGAWLKRYNDTLGQTTGH